jgi:CubicO group peptidase (beta-lactamase class C family)
VPVFRAVTLALLALAALPARPDAQQLTFELFQRYIAALREQAGIPGLSAAISQDGKIAWERGFGYENVESSTQAGPDTLYPIGDLSQTFGATLVLGRCVEGGEFELDDRVQRWNQRSREQFTTFRELLSHRLSEGPYSYNPPRLGAELTPAVEECADSEYPRLVATALLDRLGMAESVPGNDVAVSGSAARRLFTGPTLARYESLLRRVAVPYRVDGKGNATRSTYPATSLTSADGLISTVRDLARFDGALSDGVLLRRETREEAWTRSGPSPMGLGWYVQTYKGERVVWHFGLVKDAYSALLVKLPDRRLTLFLLANSDGLSAPFPMSAGDVTVSPFAKVFLGFIG